jgi:hypothetical protein
MVRIFASHSKLDKDIVSFFTAAFATSKKNVKADFMEFENLQGKYAGSEISQRIKHPETQAVFVLLGPNVKQALHTENWITFEVGVASGVGKDVWVFEPLSDTVEYPIPYLNHYVQYEPGDHGHLDFIREKIDAYDTGLVFRKDAILRNNPWAISCGHCKARYYLHLPHGWFPCPCCRTQLDPGKNLVPSPPPPPRPRDPIMELLFPGKK